VRDLPVSTAPAPHARPLLGAGLVFLAAVMFSMNGTVSTIVLGDALSPLDLVATRCLGSALILAAAALILRPRAMRIRWRELGFVAVYGVMGLAMTQWLYLVSIERIPVSVTLLIQFTAPLMVALWVRFARGEDVRGRVWIALAMCLAGLALVSEAWDGLSFDGIGTLAAVISAVTLAMYYLLGERGLGRRDPLSFAAWAFLAAGVFWSAAHPWWNFPARALGNSVDLDRVTDGVLAFHAPLWILVAFVVLIGTAAPFGLVLVAIRHIGPTRAGLIGTAEPPMAGIIAWVVLGQTLHGIQVVGAAVVLAAIVLAETARRAHPEGPIPEGIVPS